MISVLIVDDHTLVRQGIRSLLELDPDIEVTGEADDGAAAVASMELDPPDVVLLDLRMPRFDGLWTLRALQDRGIRVPVLVLTTFDDDELVLGALRAGAKGYLLKDVTFERLGGAVRELAAGRTLAQPAITQRLLNALRTGKHGASDVGVAETLTAREIDVLRLVASGYTNRSIADALHLAEGTVKNHMSSAILKLGANDRTSAVLRALRDGLLD
ncbi:DNA-binding response regulator [Rhodococcus sp. 15-725-2-2b]|uniref:response regulator n=1 Tax=unclassified Rhodococcus (in: high G+C Gram-positive bacteria) TaxID=192944 RepID=UPI000B9C6704|nr:MULTISPECIES: response regulator transcription factor [unclassified Rhodococcus (in: high G+C Gram-positive bacteria)]OZC65995.1 DNA-binding response regulator [Rhodococcus sp. 06-470-2]OZC71978.1 DNA-binding response regulator [Rhodococcus sp. 06-469-3-2]OZD39449.1 DNA-binding response regulator [Rhodococcus sp. 06-1477-1A]OZE52765.1 DNA-binding response regulator [Rhodococcus sp. 05-2221-1B]OZE68475.1 DNA-binding response regulator [Rhodococcus sp. 15-725-2-2b]